MSHAITPHPLAAAAQLRAVWTARIVVISRIWRVRRRRSPYAKQPSFGGQKSDTIPVVRGSNPLSSAEHTTRLRDGNTTRLVPLVLASAGRRF